MQSVPLLGFAQAGAGGYFDDGGFPTGKGWDEVEDSLFIMPQIEQAAVYNAINFNLPDRWVWTNIALGASGMLSVVLSVRALWSAHR